MVKDTRKKDGTVRIRPLNLPTPIEVRTDSQGQPEEVKQGKRWVKVAQVQDTWRLDDEWWRQKPIARKYFQVVLQDGGMKTIYYDSVECNWWLQSM